MYRQVGLPAFRHSLNELNRTENRHPREKFVQFDVLREIGRPKHHWDQSIDQSHYFLTRLIWVEEIPRRCHKLLGLFQTRSMNCGVEIKLEVECLAIDLEKEELR